ncbi:hypothetical protein AVEN_186379-1 [Araneus ventricosus]|uniref:RNase H type-1 domain-containing protein n=1 Tax=Araneus ventricosus TaxID=182803 RepID=A0A4Y2NM09_ARAVE|nr:hypothetical protein AVEN_186379-1 [Araneus ventricosus]
MNILHKLKSLSVSYRIHLQWIPSHVNIQGNEIADGLAKASADDSSVPSARLTYLELFSRAKSRNKAIWLIPPGGIVKKSDLKRKHSQVASDERLTSSVLIQTYPDTPRKRLRTASSDASLAIVQDASTSEEHLPSARFQA